MSARIDDITNDTQLAAAVDRLTNYFKEFRIIAGNGARPFDAACIGGFG